MQAFAAWSLARLLGSIPITPGGIGDRRAEPDGDARRVRRRQRGVVAAVLVYRFLTMVPTLVVGLGAIPTLNRRAAQRAIIIPIA